MLNDFVTYGSRDHVGLQSLINRVTTTSMPAATFRRSFIINDVPANMEVSTDPDVLATIFGTLLNTLITHTKDSCIRISARLYGKIALISLKESHQTNGHAFSANLRQLQKMAEKIGGSVSVSCGRENANTIIFSFTNNYSIAA